MYNQGGVNHHMFWSESLTNWAMDSFCLHYRTYPQSSDQFFLLEEWVFPKRVKVWMELKFVFDNGYGRGQFDESFMKLYKYFIHQICNTHHTTLWQFTPFIHSLVCLLKCKSVIPIILLQDDLYLNYKVG